ncbi:MAG: hypothetical protein K0M70_02650 [Arenimonas sp.]|uniref:hypothetical protein n=1 Tax=Arenimonas sp. TaxID=1872635 RepID=UPI0025C3B0EC|nr:hypothetical protein [Arenimonas sp.]MBW8366740.1 hypothetical protein [Arenimonas sp.]
MKTAQDTDEDGRHQAIQTELTAQIGMTKRGSRYGELGVTGIDEGIARQDVVLNVRSTNAAYIMYWHKMCLEISVLMSSGMIAVGTFGLDKSSATISVRIALVVGFLLASAAAAWLILKISAVVQEHRAILVRVDKFDRLFAKDAYLKGESLYPESWESFDAVRMDIVPKWSMFLVIATFIIMSVISMVR